MARKTKAEAEATRQSLLDAAEKVFYEKGVARASLEEIARAAGVTRGALYWHFEDKADLFRAMLERVRMPLEELAGEIPATAEPEDPLEVLRLICHIALARLENPRHRRVHAILLYRCEFFGDIDPVAIQDQLTEEAVESMAPFFERAHEQGLLETGLSPEAANRLLSSTLSGLVQRWHRNTERFFIREQGGALVDTLFKLMRRPK